MYMYVITDVFTLYIYIYMYMYICKCVCIYIWYTYPRIKCIQTEPIQKWKSFTTAHVTHCFTVCLSPFNKSCDSTSFAAPEFMVRITCHEMIMRIFLSLWLFLHTFHPNHWSLHHSTIHYMIPIARIKYKSTIYRKGRSTLSIPWKSKIIYDV